jgi:putative sterol carrier protein
MNTHDQIGDYLKQRFEDKSKKFDPQAWKDPDVFIVYDIHGSEGGQWTISIEGGKPHFKDGTCDKPTITISTTDVNFKAMMAGKLNPKMAMLTGKIKYIGDRQVMLKLRNLLS